MSTPSTVGGNSAGTVKNVVRSPLDNHLRLVAYVAIGASGAATVSQSGGALITVTKNTTGIYDVTFPPFAASATSLCTIQVRVILSAAMTVSQATCIAFSPTAGTAQFKTALNTAGTGVEPANGDALLVVVEGGKSGTF
jgi:hypothetical protein